MHRSRRRGDTIGNSGNKEKIGFILTQERFLVQNKSIAVRTKSLLASHDHKMVEFDESMDSNVCGGLQ
jgi:hypothetical protein